MELLSHYLWAGTSVSSSLPLDLNWNIGSSRSQACKSLDWNYSISSLSSQDFRLRLELHYQLFWDSSLLTASIIMSIGYLGNILTCIHSWYDPGIWTHMTISLQQLSKGRLHPILQHDKELKQDFKTPKKLFFKIPLSWSVKEDLGDRYYELQYHWEYLIFVVNCTFHLTAPHSIPNSHYYCINTREKSENTAMVYMLMRFPQLAHLSFFFHLHRLIESFNFLTLRPVLFYIHQFYTGWHLLGDKRILNIHHQASPFSWHDFHLDF